MRFIRSDQFSFVKKGIPAISYKGGLVSADPGIDGDNLTRDWLRTVYHSAEDEREQKLDYDTGARWGRVNLDLAVAIANANERPRWNEGDFFRTRFGTPASSPAEQAASSPPARSEDAPCSAGGTPAFR